MKKNRNFKIVVMAFLLIIMIIVGITKGAVKLSINDFIDLFTNKELNKAGRILLHVRLPRVFGAIIAGMGLSVAGVIIQTILNNPLAGPNIIGVNSGSGFAVVLCTVLFPKYYSILPIAAFVGAFVTVMFVYYLGKISGSSRITLVLAGVAINSVLNGLVDLVYTISEASLISSNRFKIGGLSGVDINVLKYAAMVIVISFIVVCMLHNELEIFSLGEDKAKTLGLSVSLYRFIFLSLAAALAGAAVSFAGLVGFIGLVIPHIARILVGDECKYLIISSAILGALFLLSCDYVARTWFAPYELPVGIILSFIGAPFFLWLLAGKKRRFQNA